MNLTCTNQTKETFTDKLKKTTALVYYEDKFVSSGIIFKINDKLYFITAGHSIYGKNYTEPKDVIKLKIKIGEIDLSVDEVFGDAGFAKKHDIVILKIKDNSDSLIISDITFLTPANNSLHNLLIRGSYKPGEINNYNRDIYFDETIINSSKFKIDCPKGFFVNSDYSHGADWLDGISGSGIFYNDLDDIHCCGIVVEIPNKGDDGKLICASIMPLCELVEELKISQSKFLDYNDTLREISLRGIFDFNDEKVLEDWERDTTNNPRIEFINKKLPHIYPQNQLGNEKARLIRNLRIGLDFIEIELSKKDTLMSLYNDAYKAYDMQDKVIYADSRKDARNELKNIKDKYEKYLHSMLEEEGFDNAMIVLLKEYAISEWISNCSINILKDE
jgi:hypothetical protein